MLLHLTVTVLPQSAQEFCSVGDDSCLILWDTRSGSTPVIKVKFISLMYICHLGLSVSSMHVDCVHLLKKMVGIMSFRNHNE